MLYRNHSTSIRHQRSRLFFMRPLMLMSVIDNIRLTQSKRTCLIFSPSRSFSLSSSTLDHPAVLYLSTLWLSIIISSQYRRCNEYCEHGPACIFPPTGITTGRRHITRRPPFIGGKVSVSPQQKKPMVGETRFELANYVNPNDVA